MKPEIIKVILATGRGIFLQIDGRACDLPDEWREMPDAVIALAEQMTPPVPDLDIGVLAISATLQFRGVPYHVTIPFTAIYAIGIEGTTDSITYMNSLPNLEHAPVRVESLTKPMTLMPHLKIVQ